MRGESAPALLLLALALEGVMVAVVLSRGSGSAGMEKREAKLGVSMRRSWLLSTCRKPPHSCCSGAAGWDSAGRAVSASVGAVRESTKRGV